MGWQDVQAGGGSGNFLRLKAGQKARIHVLIDEPFSFLSVFFQDIQRNAVCMMDEKDNYPAGLKWRAQHALPVWDSSDAQAKLWVMSPKVAEMVKNIYENYGGLTTIDMIISRMGSGLDTTYNVVPVPVEKGQDLSEVEIPKAEEIIVSTQPEDVEKMLKGQDPAGDFDPEELERATKLSKATVTPKTIVKPGQRLAQPATKPAPKKAVQVEEEEAPEKDKPSNGGDDKAEMLKAAIEGFKGRDIKFKMKLMQAVAKNKSSLSQFTADELGKLVDMQLQS